MCSSDLLKISEVKRFTVDAGHNLDEIESTFTVTGASEVTIGIGLNKTPADKTQAAQIATTPAPVDGSLTQWIVQNTNGSLGTAIVVPLSALQGFAEDERNQLILAKVVSGQPLRYLAGAGWSKAGEFTTPQAWSEYVAACALRFRSPVRVSVAAQ